jgi:diguanylate cyclase
VVDTSGRSRSSSGLTRAMSLKLRRRKKLSTTPGRLLPDRTVASPLTILAGGTGEIRLHFDSSVALDSRERHALGAFAGALSAALHQAEMYAEMRRLAERKAHEAEHDGLTGLRNRNSLLHIGEELFREAAQRAETVAVLALDLDHFKEVNDTLGHSAGDQLLREIAERLQRAVERGGVVARLGGDEFAVLLPGIVEQEHATAIAEELLAILGEPTVVEGLRLSAEVSIGVAYFPHDGDDVSELLRLADSALYQAKQSGNTVETYQKNGRAGRVERLSTLDELRTALRDDQLELHYQPKVDLRSGKFIGIEALARWRHPTRGLVPPIEFIPVVETSNLIGPFTLRVVDLALGECARWTAAGHPSTVAVNLSARNLLDRDLPAEISAALTRHQVPPKLLVVEITETAMMSELDVVDTVVSELYELGVQISLDDFGTGYSSLTFVSRVPLHELKIDRSFVADIASSPGAAGIVRATIELARSFGLRVVAEGVETAAQVRALARLGCEAAQGYFLAAPMPAEEIRQALQSTWVQRSVVDGGDLIPIDSDQLVKPMR